MSPCMISKALLLGPSACQERNKHTAMPQRITACGSIKQFWLSATLMELLANLIHGLKCFLFFFFLHMDYSMGYTKLCNVFNS